MSTPRNDRLGKQFITDADDGAYTCFASGVRGYEIRGDGKGGLLARGYHVVIPNVTTLGPCSSRAKAIGMYRDACK